MYLLMFHLKDLFKYFFNMETIIISGVSINIKQYGVTEDEILNDFRLRNLLNYVINEAKKI